MPSDIQQYHFRFLTQWKLFYCYSFCSLSYTQALRPRQRSISANCKFAGAKFEPIADQMPKYVYASHVAICVNWGVTVANKGWPIAGQQPTTIIRWPQHVSYALYIYTSITLSQSLTLVPAFASLSKSEQKTVLEQPNQSKFALCQHQHQQQQLEYCNNLCMKCELGEISYMLRICMCARNGKVDWLISWIIYAIKYNKYNILDTLKKKFALA